MTHPPNARGTTTQQGYGWTHQQCRQALILRAIGTRCPDCGNPMANPTQMVADHTIPLSHNRRSRADRVHCRDCSNKQGGKLRHSRRNRPTQPHPGGITP